MEDQIRETIYLDISLIIMSVFVALLVVFGWMGNKLVYGHQDRVARSARLEKQSEFYRFIGNGDTAKPDKTVSGADIVRLITKYGTLYDYYVDVGSSKKYDIRYDSTLHKEMKKKYIELMGYSATTAAIKNMEPALYTVADMALWSQGCLDEYVFGNEVYSTFIAYVTIDKGTDEITTDIDEIIDNPDLITFKFKKIN